jgi:hypothetical protein
MTTARVSAFRLVLVPAIITLAMSLLRLLGETRGWAPAFFKSDPGGPGSVIGIVWLVPIFGFYFGWRLAVAGQAPRRPSIAELWHLLGIALMIGAGAGMPLLGFELPGSLVPSAIANLLCALLALWSWPPLFRVNLLYAILARVPVMAITAIAVQRAWRTHYEKLGRQDLQMDALPKTLWLVLAQIGFWIPFTILFGGLFGCIGARFARAIARARARARASA